MRIIHLVLGNAGAQTTNGVAKVAHKIASSQTKLAHNVSLWCISKSLKDNYLSRNYKTRLFLKQGNPFNLDPEIYSNVSSLNKGDIVHFHGSFIPEFYQIAALLQDLDIPYVVTPHGEMSPGALNFGKWWKLPYYYLFEKKLLNNALTVHVLGASGKSMLSKLGCKSPVVVIPNGQDINEVKYFENKPQRPFTICFCGDIDIYMKGLDIALKGFKQFLVDGRGAKFEIIGSGKDLTALELMVQNLGLQDNVRLHGNLSTDQKYKVLSKSDAFLRTSRADGFPITILEASAMGIPSIVSKSTNTAEYIIQFDSGFVLDKNTPNKVAKMLKHVSRLSSEGKLLKSGLNAREMVQRQFSWQQLSIRILNLYLKQHSKKLNISY